MTRRLAGLLLAVAAASGWLVSPVAVDHVRAATPDLTIVTNARYDVQPDAHRVRVTLDMELTNHLADTRTKRYYFDHAFLSVLPGASNVKLSWSGAGTPRAGISKQTAASTLVRLDLAERIYSGRSASYRLMFDLVDKGGAASRDVRVGGSVVSFPVWAYATGATPGSTVRVVFPAGYHVEVGAGEIPPPATDATGGVVFQTGKLDKPLAFFAYLVADRPGAEVVRTVRTTVGDKPVEVMIRAWTDDAPWSDRVGGLVGRGLPLLQERIGLPWPRDEGLVVHETVSRSTGGYAGLFDPANGQIEVAFDAGDDVVLHEAAHAWFNGALLADRWANEAFASFYGREVATALKVKSGATNLTPELEAAHIPLNAWGAIGREDHATEGYAYAASLELARAIFERTGPDGLRAVWADAAGRVGAYQPPVPGVGSTATVGGGSATPETVDGAPDWRGLLDLVDAHSSTPNDDLWRTWVARDADLVLLDARAVARARYERILAAAGDWRLPRAIRDGLRSWRFDQTNLLLADASAILDQRNSIASAASASGLAVPDTLRTAFERADGFASATLEAVAERESIARYDSAVAARPTRPDLLENVGLWGTAPEDLLVEARARFASGDMTGSAAAAGSATAIWSSASDVGRGRIVSLAALLVATLLALVVAAVWIRGRRRGPRRSTVAGVDPYATLAATPDPVEGAAAGETGAIGAEPD